MKQGILFTANLFISMLCLFSSCCETVECGPWRTTEITAINFTQQELANFSVRKFNSNSNFASAIDSTWLSKGVDYNLIDENGTSINIVFVNDNPTRFPIEAGYDYELLFPNGNTIKRITEISDLQSDDRFCFTGFAKNSCYNSLASLKIDGVIATSVTLQK